MKAAQVTKRLLERKLIRYAGSVKGGGRPEIVYCGYHVPEHLFAHELPITDLIGAFGWPHSRRAADVDEKVLPDAELFLNGVKYLLEYDTGSMRKHHIHARWRKYEGDETVLVVTSDENRLKDLLEWSEVLGDRAVFTTLQGVLNDPWGDVWVDLQGEPWAIEQPVEQGTE